MMTRIDSPDKGLVEILQGNTRLTNGDLAAQMGVSEATVRRHIDKLLEKEVIQIRAVADPFKLGRAVIVIIGLWVEKAHLREAEE